MLICDPSLSVIKFDLCLDFGSFTLLEIDSIMYTGCMEILQTQSMQQFFQTNSVRNQFVVRTVM